jgi:hypothetical protein
MDAAALGDAISYDKTRQSPRRRGIQSLEPGSCFMERTPLWQHADSNVTIRPPPSSMYRSMLVSRCCCSSFQTPLFLIVEPTEWIQHRYFFKHRFGSTRDFSPVIKACSGDAYAESTCQDGRQVSSRLPCWFGNGLATILDELLGPLPLTLVLKQIGVLNVDGFSRRW